MCEQKIDINKTEPVLQKYKNKKGALIPILQEVEEIFGYLPREALEKISGDTRIPLSKVYGVVTFYSQFYLNRRGRNIVKVCRGTACHVKGARTVRESVEEVLGIKDGETTPDYKFTIETIACLGTCFLAPVMMINQSYYGRLSRIKVKTILENIT